MEELGRSLQVEVTENTIAIEYHGLRAAHLSSPGHGWPVMGVPAVGIVLHPAQAFLVRFVRKSQWGDS